MVTLSQGGCFYLRKLKLAAPLNLGPKISVQFDYDDENYPNGDIIGIVAVMEIDDIPCPLLRLTEGESMLDVADIGENELNAFIRRVRELAERNGCRFDEFSLATLKDEFHEIKNTS